VGFNYEIVMAQDFEEDARYLHNSVDASRGKTTRSGMSIIEMRGLLFTALFGPSVSSCSLMLKGMVSCSIMITARERSLKGRVMFAEFDSGKSWASE